MVMEQAAISRRRPAPMGSSPERERPLREWSWLQFTFGFVIAGVVAFLNLRWPLDALWIHLLKTTIVAAICGALAGRFGDAAWRGIVRILKLI